MRFSPPTPITWTYTHDAWNRLVKVVVGSDTRAEYHYNGLDWCIIKQADTDFDGTLDQQRMRYYSAGWQLCEERIDDDSTFPTSPTDPDIDRHVQYVAGAQYIDDYLLHREDNNTDGTYDDTYYHLTDAIFSTRAIIDDAANLKERVTYDAYGNARHHRKSDLDGDGASGEPDNLIILANWGNFGAGDLDRSGTVGVGDLLIQSGDTGGALAEGEITFASSVDNQIGFTGHVFNAEVRMYTMRMRCYLPKLGRFIERDPAEYIDGMNLYEYVGGNPLNGTDPYGLFAGAGNARGLQDVPGIAEMMRTLNKEAKDLLDWMEPLYDATINAWIFAGMVVIPVSELGLLARLLGYAGKPGSKFVAWLGRLFAKCYVAGTMITTPSGEVPIEEIDVGDRVVAIDTVATSSTEVDPATWRLVTLHLQLPDSERMEVRWLRPLDWIDAVGCAPGRWIMTGLPELGIYVPARVIDVEDCPAIEPGPGNVVLTTFHSRASDVLEITLDGTEEPLSVTSSHNLYSADRDDWVAVSDLRVGETLRTRDGTARITAIEGKPGTFEVFNIQVEQAHQYFAGEFGVLSHNDVPPDFKLRGGGGRRKAPWKKVPCFAAGTPVMTASGSVPIEQIRIGDPVWAFDEPTGKLMVTRVVQTYVNTEVPIFDVVITHADGTREVIHTTAGHPFYVKDRGWVPAMYLGSNDKLSSLSGEVSTSVEVINTGRRETVYNLAVAEAHTYFVGEGGVLVHNNCADKAALIALAKYLKLRGRTRPVTNEERRIMRDWAREYDVPFRPKKSVHRHPDRGYGKNPHIHIGPVNHIPCEG